MQIKFLGAVEGAGEVTGSRTLLTTPDGLNILIDFGMLQSNLGNIAKTLQWNGRDFEFDIEDIDYLILTHGHFDHIGGVPLLIKRGFKGKIISTAPTAEFCELSLPDSAKIMASDCVWANKRRPKNKLEPLYTIEEAKKSIKYIQCYDFNTEIVLSDNVSVELLCAGHILGACMPKITYKDSRGVKTILFTGDTSAKTESKPFLRPADDMGEIDYLVCESTYGDRAHTKDNPMNILEESAVETCLENRKTLILPVFSLQRSSEIIWMLREIYLRNNELFTVPVYLDTPMGIKAQSIMDNNREYWGEKWIKRDKMLTNIFEWEVLQYVDRHGESLLLHNDDPKIILSSSGMASGGRILHHLEHFLPKKGCKVLFSGHQVDGTLGRKLLDGRQKSVAINRSQATIRAKIDGFSFSSHADVNQLIEFIKTTKKGRLKKILLNHGDIDAVNSFIDELNIHFRGVRIMKPEYNKSIKL